MSNFESIEVTIPCRECDQPLQARCRKKNAEDPSRGGASLIGSCEEHGEMKMKLKKDPDSDGDPWYYMNRFDVELGRGETPQDAVNSFHNQADPEPSAAANPSDSEPEQDTDPESDTSTGENVPDESGETPSDEELMEPEEAKEQEPPDDTRENDEAENDVEASSAQEPSDPSQDVEDEQTPLRQSEQPEPQAEPETQQDEPAELSADESSSEPSMEEPSDPHESGSNPIGTLEDLPKWFRTQSRSIDWLRQMDSDPAEIFGHRFVIIGRFNRSKNAGALSFIGTDQRKDVIEMAKKGMEDDSEIVLVRDQQEDTFLKAEMKVVLIEISQPDIEGNEKVQHIDTIKAKRSTA